MIKAIETSYAGCRFRSRLEARWAVFFDRMGIRWDYETQGYMVGPEGCDRPYLPDFWLPVERLWVEVKGNIADLDHELTLNAVIPHWGLANIKRDRHSMLILGPVPRPGGRVAHSILTFHKGDVMRDWAEFSGIGGLSVTEPHHGEMSGPHWLGNDSGDIAKPDPSLTDVAHLPGMSGNFIEAAYTAARSARFEYGQRGA